MQAPNRAKWLLLIHQIPAKPDYLRVKVGRELRRLGAVAIKNSVYAVPATIKMREALGAFSREVLQRGGEAAVCEATFIEGIADGVVEDLFRKASDEEYAALAREAKSLASGLRGRRALSEAARRSASRKLERLRARFDEVVARDRFGAAGRAGAAGQLSLAEDRLEGVDEGAKRSAGEPDPPRGATWVTRAGVMVDRIASAWLIRRFIDPRAAFKFVSARGYRPIPGEIRFDMTGAEFTHEGDRCTFEVLVDRFRLRDSALKPLGEIVHDVDLRDGKHKRPETAGVERMIVGLAIAEKEDEARLRQGAAVFENLYESFRR